MDRLLLHWLIEYSVLLGLFFKCSSYTMGAKYSPPSINVSCPLWNSGEYIYSFIGLIGPYGKFQKIIILIGDLANMANNHADRRKSTSMTEVSSFVQTFPLDSKAEETRRDIMCMTHFVYWAGELAQTARSRRKKKDGTGRGWTGGGWREQEIRSQLDSAMRPHRP